MFKKIISMLMVFLLLLQISPDIFASTKKESNDNLQYLQSQVIRELENQRTEKAKFFGLKTGQVLETRYPIPIHKRSKNGNWDDVYKDNRDNFIYFAKNMSEPSLVTICRDDYEILWKYEDTSNTEISDVIDTHKVYKNVFKNIDLDYMMLENCLKENLVLNTRDTLQEFVVNYKFKNLKAVQIDSQNIELLNKNDKSVYTISAPEMIDSAKISCKNLSLQILKNENEELKVKIICDKIWLDDESRIYPVLVDPNIASETKEWTLVPRQLVRTGWKKKKDNSSIFLDLTGSDFKGIGIVYVCVYGHKSSSGSECGDNCSFATRAERDALGPVVASYRCYLLEANKKYELLNIVNETGCDEYELRFYNSGLDSNTQTENVNINLKAGWNPDFVRPAEPGTITVGNTNKVEDGSGGNIRPDSPLNLVISPSGTCFSSFRTKSNTTSVYLDLTDSHGGETVDVQIFGTYALYHGGYDTTLSVKNCTYSTASYTLTRGKKYYLWNTVREDKRTGVYLKFSGTSGTEIKGKWSPDYATETGCEKMPGGGAGGGTSMKTDQVPTKIIDFTACYADQKSLGLPRGCELASTYMLLKKLGINVTVDELVGVVPSKPYSAGVNPLEFFIGVPKGTTGTFGCFNSVISGTINSILNKRSIWDRDARVIRGKSMTQLIRDYIDQNIPVLIWATSDLMPLKFQDTSVVLPNGDIGPWPGNEHCMVLIGYNSDHYFVANPENKLDGTPKGIGAFPKVLFEQMYAELGKQAVVVQPSSAGAGSLINQSAIFSSPKPGEIISRGCEYLLQSTKKDGQESHKLLQRVFEKEYAPRVKYTALTEEPKNKPYRCDMLLIENLKRICEVYEIKPFRHYIWKFAKLNPDIFEKIKLEVLGEFGKFISKLVESQQGSAQLKRYIEEINKDRCFKSSNGFDTAKTGETYLRTPKTLLNNDCSRQYYYTSNYGSDPGMIYWIYKNKQPQKEYEAIAVKVFELIKVHAHKLIETFAKAWRENKDHIIIDGQVIAMGTIIFTIGFGIFQLVYTQDPSGLQAVLEKVSGGGFYACF